MKTFTIPAWIRFGALAAVLASSVAAIFAAGGIYLFGSSIENLRANELMAMQAANGMQLSLYQMEWGVTRPGGGQILMDQRRQFAHWIELARDRANGQEQITSIEKIARQADALTDGLAQAVRAGRVDDELDRRMREVQSMVNDLISSNDAVLLNLSTRIRHESSMLIAVLILGAVVIPAVCVVFISRWSSQTNRALVAIRGVLEKIAARIGANMAEDRDLKVVDDALTTLGYPAPNPMLDR